VVVLELDLEHGIGQGFHNHCHHLNRVFLRQAFFRFCQRPYRAPQLVLPSLYSSVIILAPVGVTATVCSK
jgi:hypothetical protein